MFNHGYYYGKIALYLSIIIAIWFSIALGQNYYYTCAYDSNLEINNILISKINLDDNAIDRQLSIPIKGEIAFRVPISINLPNRQFLVVINNDGPNAKNSSANDTLQSNYAVLDSGLNILRTGNVNDVNFIRALSYPMNPQRRIRYLFHHRDIQREISGRLGLNIFRSLSLLDTVNYIYRDTDYPIIGGFQYSVLISFENDSLYWNIGEYPSLYILKIDYQHSILLDSLKVANNLAHASIFGLSGDSLIFYFWLNYNTLNAGPQYDKYAIDPSYLIRYNTRNFAKVDSIPIPNPPLDYGYIQPEMGSCDKIGPYFVYYFFEDEGPEIFSPAMLFIFDTRTNEATWLRVGWR